MFDESVGEVHHPNGLTLRLSESLEAEQTPAGFILRPRGWRELRAPFVIEVSFHAGRGPAGEWPHTRRINGRPVHYRIDRNEGGSGGQMHVLTAWEETPSGYVLLRHCAEVEEPFTSDFTPGWSLLAGARAPED